MTSTFLRVGIQSFLAAAAAAAIGVAGVVVGSCIQRAERAQMLAADGGEAGVGHDAGADSDGPGDGAYLTCAAASGA